MRWQQFQTVVDASILASALTASVALSGLLMLPLASMSMLRRLHRVTSERRTGPLWPG